MNPIPSVSVVVPTFQRRASLARLIASLSEQRFDGARLEVVVVDDGSSDGTVEWLRSVEDGARLRAILQRHAGPSAARNRGVAEATGDLIVFLDDDVVPEAGLINAHIAAHEAAPNSVVVGPMLPPDRWKRPVWIRWEEQKLLQQYRQMAVGRYPCTYRQFFTANASVRREHLLAAGGFDVSFDRAEDVELGFRLRRLGLSFVFEPGARVRHYPGRSFASWRRTPYRYGRADVVMDRDKGIPALEQAFEELEDRSVATRVVTRVCVGRPVPFRLATSALVIAAHAAGAAGRLGIANAALSGLFSLLYWQGVSDALRDPEVLRRVLVPRNTDGVS